MNMLNLVKYLDFAKVLQMLVVIEVCKLKQTVQSVLYSGGPPWGKPLQKTIHIIEQFF